MLTEALNERIIVAENGRRRKITERKATVTQVVNRAAKGGWRGTKLVLDIEKDIERRADAAAPQAAAFGEADHKVIAQLKARLNRNNGGSG